MPHGQKLSVTDKSAFLSPRRTALAAVLAVTAMGPIAEARRVTSWPEYRRLYGGHIAGRPDTHVIKRALDGGCELMISRVVHYTDPTDAGTRTSAAASVTLVDRGAAPTAGQSTGSSVFPLRFAPGGTLVVSIDGGSDATATFAATAATALGSGATFAAVTSGHALVLVVGGVRREVQFTTENSLTAYLATINAVPGLVAADVGGELSLTTDHRGSGASLVVHADSDADVLAALGLATGAATGSGNVANIEAVTALEFETIVEAAVSGCAAGETSSHNPFIRSITTGLGSSVRVQPASTLDDECGFDNDPHTGSATAAVNTLRLEAATDGTWAHDIDVEVLDDPGDPSTRFRIVVVDATGALAEDHVGLSMVATDSRYVANVLREESLLLRAVDLDSVSVAPADRPAVGSFNLTGGDDGLVGLVGADYLGDATLKTGVHAFDTARGFRLLSSAGFVDHDASADLDAWCFERLDCAQIANVPLAVTNSTNAIAYRRRGAPYATGTAIDSFCTALYAGWHEVLDPLTRQPLWLPADGEVLAALAAASAQLGPWLALAGENRARLPRTVRRLRFTPSSAELTAMKAAGVNSILAEDSGGGVVYSLEGQQSLFKSVGAIDGGSDLQSLNVVLLTHLIGESAQSLLRPFRYDPNDAVLWGQMFDAVDPFMQALASPQQRALEGYRLVCDETNNTPEARAAKRSHFDVYFTAIKASEEQHIGLVVTASGVKLTQ